MKRSITKMAITTILLVGAHALLGCGGDLEGPDPAEGKGDYSEAAPGAACTFSWQCQAARTCVFDGEEDPMGRCEPWRAAAPATGDEQQAYVYTPFCQTPAGTCVRIPPLPIGFECSCAGISGVAVE